MLNVPFFLATTVHNDLQFFGVDLIYFSVKFNIKFIKWFLYINITLKCIVWNKNINHKKKNQNFKFAFKVKKKKTLKYVKASILYQ